MRIEPVGPVPDLDQYETVIFTSGNGVRRLGNILKGRRVATVGEATAKLAQSLGADAACHGETLADFLSRVEYLPGRTLYCRGVHSRGNMAEALNERGFDVEEAVVYDQVAVSLTAEAQEILVGKSKVSVPLFSPRSARLLSEYTITADVTVVAISHQAAEAWQAGGRTLIAEKPTAEAMCRAVLDAI